jgi:hypothetical protein
MAPDQRAGSFSMNDVPPRGLLRNFSSTGAGDDLYVEVPSAWQYNDTHGGMQVGEGPLGS